MWTIAVLLRIGDKPAFWHRVCIRDRNRESALIRAGKAIFADHPNATILAVTAH